MTTIRPRRWRKRLLWLTAIALVGRLLLAVAMPWLVDLGAAAIGCTAHYRTASLSLFGLSLQVQDLEVHDAAHRDEPPLLAAKDVTADLSTWDLLHGKFVVVVASVSGGRVALRRTADGTLQLPAALQTGPAATVAATPMPAAPAAQPTGTPSLTLPFCITSARIHDLRVQLHDESTSPVRDVEAIVDVDVNELGHLDRPGNLRIRVHSPGLLDHFQAQANITAANDRLALQWEVVVRGLQVSELRLSSVAHAAFDNSNRADFELGGSLTAEPSHSSVTPFAGTAELHARVVLDAIERARVRATVGPTTLDGNQFVLPFHTELYGSQIVERLDLANGRIEVGPDRLGLAAALDCRGLTLRRLTTFLRERGISIVDSGVDATASLSAEIAPRNGGKLTARLQGLSLRHADEGIELRAVNVLDVALVPAGIDIGAVEIEGPAVTVAREADGTIAVAGLRFYADASRAAPTEPEAKPAAAVAPKQGTQVTVQRLAWRGANLRFTDGTLPGSPTFVLADLSLIGEGWNFGGADLPTGHAALSLRLPGSVEDLHADLRLQQGTQGATADLRLDAKGLTARELGPWLAPLGIAPQLQDATLSLTATASMANTAGHTTISGQLADLRLQDRDRLLVGLKNAALTNLVTGADQLDLGTLRIDEPRFVLDRETDGAWTIAGLRFRPAPPPTPTDPGQAAEPAPPEPAATKTPVPWRSGAVTLRGAQIAWHDLRRTPHPLALVLDADLGPRRGFGSPMTFTAMLQLERAIEALELRGEVVADGEALQVGAELSSRGIRGDGLATLLPDDLTATLVDGSLHARLAAQTRTLPSGTTLDLVVSEVLLSDRGAELAAIDRLELHAPQLGQNLLHVQSLQVEGLRATAAQTDAGLQVPGLLLRNPALVSSATNAAAPKPSDSNQPSPAAKGSSAVGMPALRMDRLDVQCERIEFVDRRGDSGSPNTTPMAIAARLQLQQPWATTPELAESPPASLLVTASVEPLCAAVRIELQLQPFHLAPSAEVDLRAEGLDPVAIANFSPLLAARLGGTTADATVHAKLYGSLELRRRDPTRFDFDKPFGAHLLIEDLDVRETGSNDPFATVAAIDVQVRAIDPRTGDVLLKSVDIDTPRLRATRTAAGLEVAGLLLRNTPAANPSNPTPPPAETGAPEPEFAVDRLRIQGLGFDFRDSTTTPVTHLPIHDLDLDLQRFSTRIFTSPRPFAFELNVHGGDVELTKRVLRSSIAAGMVGSTTNALLWNRDQHQLEQRPLFQDLTVTGQMQVYPLPKGSCRLDLTGFEMPAIRGLANHGGVIINDGLLDLSVAAQMEAGAGTKVKSGITFTWLSMSEPPNGPISTYLKLPAPLDTVLFLLRNDADEQRLPLQLHLPATGVSPNAIAEAAIEALTLAIGDAVARSPFRVAGVVTNLFDLGRQRPDLGNPVTLDCRPGDIQPDLGNLAGLLAATKDDPEIKFVLTHDLGKGDIDRATVLANPPPEVVRAAIDRLRTRRLALLAARTPIAAEAAAQFAAARHDALYVLARLEAVDKDLGALDTTLDEALAMLDGNTARDRIRNARRAAVGLASLRLELVREELERLLPRGSADRIEVRPARGIPADGLEGGGRVVITPRQRAPATDQRR